MLACTLAACGDATTSTEALYPRLVVRSVEPAVVLPGTRLHITADGLVDGVVARYRVTFRGNVDGAPLDVTVDAAPDPEADDVLVAVAPEAFATASQAAASDLVFDGAVIVTRETDDASGDAEAERAETLVLQPTLTATVTSLDASELYAGDPVVVSCTGALLPGEGTTLVRFDGVFTDEAGPHAVHAIDGLVVPGEASGTDRGTVAFTLTPDVFGIRPGEFAGEVALVNVHADGRETRSDPLIGVSLALRPPRITDMSPLRASRGQKVIVTGRGLLPADGLLQTATILLLEGVFSPRRAWPVSYEGADAIAVYPDAIDGNTRATTVLRTVIGDDGRPTGLGAVAGRFVGRVTPLVLFGEDAVAGTSLPIDFEIMNPKQVVHIRFLPGFSDALVRFGLLAERKTITDRVLEVLQRDYAGVNITFGYDAPTDFAEYEVVEVGGEDPNGTQLFGLDNTEGKDVGNLRFDDVIGGFNADTRAHSYAAYGGIFVSELMNLSARVGDSELASARFDDIFGPVAPELGGTPAKVGEGDSFDERGVAVRKAARVLGNLIGTTITHEVGHSLGLTAIEGRYHNEGDNPAWIMDAGQFRPFEERAEIDGQGPGVFEPFNRIYLESILPLDPEGPEPEP